MVFLADGIFQNKQGVALCSEIYLSPVAQVIQINFYLRVWLDSLQLNIIVPF
uniref:Uncharacterized protein n=1 Tax=Arundo donax TaxID=35708 RepID=A0A0A9CVK9_ARUDO